MIQLNMFKEVSITPDLTSPKKKYSHTEKSVELVKNQIINKPSKKASKSKTIDLISKFKMLNK